MWRRFTSICLLLRRVHTTPEIDLFSLCHLMYVCGLLYMLINNSAFTNKRIKYNYCMYDGIKI